MSCLHHLLDTWGVLQCIEVGASAGCAHQRCDIRLCGRMI